jgi:hypothetical protein
MVPVTSPDAAPRLSTDAAMDDVRAQVRAALRERLVARGSADDFTDERVFAEVDGLLRRALRHTDRHALLMPDLLAEAWRPELSLDLSGHRRGAAAAIVLFVKRRVLLPLTRWLFEYALENFRRQDRLNIALMACVQTLAADHARLQLRVAALEAARDTHDRAAPATAPTAR